MTITEHLEFSVLTAPIASLDRRTLSQAWYSALYGERSAAKKALQNPAPQIHPRTVMRSPVPEAAFPAEPREARLAQSVRSNGNIAKFSGGSEIERRGPRSALARKIARTFAQQKGAAGKAAFALDAGDGRVQVILQGTGGRVKLVAICSPKAKAQVVRALTQARYALAVRGIDLDTQAREYETW